MSPLPHVLPALPGGRASEALPTADKTSPGLHGGHVGPPASLRSLSGVQLVSPLGRRSGHVASPATTARSAKFVLCRLSGSSVSAPTLSLSVAKGSVFGPVPCPAFLSPPLPIALLTSSSLSLSIIHSQEVRVCFHADDSRAGSAAHQSGAPNHDAQVPTPRFITAREPRGIELSPRPGSHGLSLRGQRSMGTSSSVKLSSLPRLTSSLLPSIPGGATWKPEARSHPQKLPRADPLHTSGGTVPRTGNTSLPHRHGSGQCQALTSPRVEPHWGSPKQSSHRQSR